ncbi:MAG: heparinase II/III domain-containing protein [Acidimicrobiales bacterium]
MIRGHIEEAVLLARTTRNLRASQIAHRIRLRAQRFPPSRPLASTIIGLLPDRARPVVGWPAAFAPLDFQLGEGCPSPEENAAGRFSFLRDGRDLGTPLRWDAPGAPRLWTYHLHYMEWAWSFACHPDARWARDAFAGLWRSWERASTFGRGDAWHPYVASLRAWALCGTYASLVAGTPVQADVDASLARHVRFLRWHLEHDVGGNHLLKNLKALVGLGVFLGDDALVHMAVAQLQRQVGIQVLSDGGHYERSPSYHCQVLGDFVDIAALLETSGRPAVDGLADAVQRMRTWLGVMQMPDGDVPLFNDCVLVGQARLSLLQPVPAAPSRLTVLPASGYVVARPDERLHLVADVGDPCPPDLPAHAHADCLSFELAVDGLRLVVDSGTSTYAPGEERARERSTAAHNTVTVDDVDQTEVWGTFRAARLARATLEGSDDDGRTIAVVASHDGYRRLPGAPVHRRTWRVTPGQVEILDQIVGHGEHRIRSQLLLTRAGGCTVTWSGPPTQRVSEGAGRYATGFGQVHDGHLMSAAWQGRLPVALGATLHLDGPAPDAGRVDGGSLTGSP